MKARVIIKGDPDEIGESICNAYKDQLSLNFDQFQINSRFISEDRERHIFLTQEDYDVNSANFLSQFLDKRHAKVVNYWCKDEMGSFYFIRKSEKIADKTGKYMANYAEAFVCTPLTSKSDSCIIYFFSDFNYGTQGNILTQCSIAQDSLKLQRMSVLASYLDYYKFQN
eukprot:CAMPEP_0170543224 /NCGR_PEP_ID=MMETSP0211-20121228/2415_1 /TAXON_ID=311385 /ORGANISM="Pseudokeronopsis sp., Strain OXSARD2" /LENGTH=168 /DNA_ID=CAMNT_0010846547 /DNA_START=928 /DNA_END=1434 /DNA_ORIENTATION=-